MDEVFRNIIRRYQPGYTNEMMTAITNACDMNGNPISFIANKYEAAFKELEKNGELELNFNMPFRSNE